MNGTGAQNIQLSYNYLSRSQGNDKGQQEDACEEVEQKSKGDGDWQCRKCFPENCQEQQSKKQPL